MRNSNLIGISGKIGSGKDTVGAMIQFIESEYYYHGQILNPFSTSFSYTPNNYSIKKFAYKLKQICSLLTGIPVEEFEKEEVKSKVLGEEWWQVTNPKIIPRMDYKLNHEYGSKITIHKTTVRDMLQRVGTEAMRNIIHSNVWVNALFADYLPPLYWMCDRCGNEKLENLIEIASRFKEQGYTDNEFVCPVCKGEESEGDITQVISLSDEFSKWIITDVRFPNEAQAIKDRGGILIRIDRDYALRGGPEDPKMQHPSETALDNYQGFDNYISNEGTLGELLTKVEVILQVEKII